MATYYVVRAVTPIKAGTKGYCDMLCNPIKTDAAVGRRLRMEKDAAIKAVLAGKVEMLSPDGIRDVALAQVLDADLADDGLPAKSPPPRRKATYKTRVESAEES